MLYMKNTERDSWVPLCLNFCYSVGCYPGGGGYHVWVIYRCGDGYQVRSYYFDDSFSVGGYTLDVAIAVEALSKEVAAVVVMLPGMLF